jgi:phosphatidylglycerophosphate synthase
MKSENKIKVYWINLLFIILSLVITFSFSYLIRSNYSQSPEEYVPEIDKGLLRILYITLLIVISFEISSSKATNKLKFILLFILNFTSVLYILEYWPNIKEIGFLGLKFNS